MPNSLKRDKTIHLKITNDESQVLNEEIQEEKFYKGTQEWIRDAIRQKLQNKLDKKYKQSLSQERNEG